MICTLVREAQIKRPIHYYSIVNMSVTQFLPWLLASLYLVDTDKVLLVSHQLNSHLMQVHMVGEGLANNGHQVYSILQHGFIKPEKLPMNGIQPIYFYTPEQHHSSIGLKDFDQIAYNKIFQIEQPDFMTLLKKSFREMCDIILGDVNLLNALRSHQFDMAVVDNFMFDPCNFLVPHVLGIKYVSVGAPSAMFIGGTPSLPSFVPFHMFSLSDDMTFTDRLKNFLISHISTTRLFPPNDNTSLLEEFAPELADWYGLVERSLIHCVPSNYILSWPAPSMPNVIRTPGITIKPAKSLPPDLESIISSQNSPLVVMSFGSAFAKLPKAITLKFVAAFSQVNYTIVWRLDAESSSQVTIPDNVHVVSWLPQNDLLGHPATKLFITHCGNNGQYEAVYQGVPMIGFPLFAEQPHNCFRMEYHKLGKCMDIRTFDPDLLLQYMNEVSGDGSVYHEAVKKRSAILRDTDVRPVDTMIRWIEHVMTHGGEHLHSHAVDMPWYQYWMLDVLSLIVISITVTLATLIWIVRRMCSSKPKKEKQQ